MEFTFGYACFFGAAYFNFDFLATAGDGVMSWSKSAINTVLGVR